jgi:uncharacterized protein (TIGR03437 family)
VTVANQTISVTQQPGNDVGVGSEVGAPGGVARLPVSLVIIGNTSYNSLTLNVSITPAANLSFQPAPGAPVPQVTTSSSGLTLTYSNATPPFTPGTTVLGEILVPIPAGTPTTQTYTVQTVVQGPQFSSPSSNATVFVGNTPNLKVTWISPSSAAPGSSGTAITVYGEGFTPSSLVLWNNNIGPATTFVSESQLQAVIPSSDLTAAGSGQVSVCTPPNNGGAIMDFSNATPFLVTSATPPQIGANGIVNAAGYTTQLAGGDIAALFGTNLAPAIAIAGAIPLPTSLNGVSVLVDGIPAPLFYISPGQINFQMPWRLLAATQTTIAVTINGLTSNAETISLIGAAPAVLAINQQGTGQGVIVGASNLLAAEPGSVPGMQSAAAPIGGEVAIYCLGLGAINQSIADGYAATTAPTITSNLQVTIGGLPANVVFSGMTVGFVGLYQVNVTVPAGVAPGAAVPVTMSINGVASNTVTMAIQ